MFQPLATYLRRQNELINLAITQVVELPPAVGIGALGDHTAPVPFLLRRLIHHACETSSVTQRREFRRYCLSWRRGLIEVRAGVGPKRAVRASEVANPDRPYLLSPPEYGSQDRSRTVDDRR